MKYENGYKHLPRVEVVWIDAESGDPWECNAEASMEFPVIYSVGFVLMQDDTGILLTSSLNTKSEQNFGRLMIPRGCIEEIREI